MSNQRVLIGFSQNEQYTSTWLPNSYKAKKYILPRAFQRYFFHLLAFLSISPLEFHWTPWVSHGFPYRGPQEGPGRSAGPRLDGGRGPRLSAAPGQPTALGVGSIDGGAAVAS